MRLVITDGIARLTLSRPGARNGMDPTFVTEASAALDAIEADATVRTLLITAEGPSFCVGGDLAFFSARPDNHAADFGWMVDNWHRYLARLAVVPFPVIAAVHGGTAGGGLGFVFCADYVIAADNTKIATGFADIGLSGDGGSTWYLPRLVGMRRAQSMILDNLAIDAATAVDWGIVTTVVPLDELGEAAEKTARRFASRSATAFRRAKRLLLESSVHPQREHLEAEAAAIHECAASADVAHSIQAFAKRERPVFTDAY